MTQVPVRIGVVGCGNRLRSVVKLLLETGGEQLRLTAIHDPLDESVAVFQREVGGSAVRLATAEAVCTSPEVDWVMVGSWNCFHATQVIAALRAGKHVFCEKPLATTVEDCLQLREVWRESGRCFFFGLVLRYSPLYQRVHALLAAGAIGPILSFEFNETLAFNHGGYIHGNWRRHREYAGTHLLEKCCHDIDIANWLTRSYPVRAASFGGRDFFGPQNRAFATALGRDAAGRPAYQTWWDPQRVDPFSPGSSIVDHQVAILEYAQGGRATFHTNCNAALPERRLYLLGARGAIRADALTRRIEVARIGFDATPEVIQLPSTGDDHFGGDKVMVEHLCRTMTEGAPPLASMDEALLSALSCLGIDQAQDTQAVVDLHPLWARAGLASFHS